MGGIETFGTLLTTAKQYTGLSNSTDFDAFLKKELNKSYREVLSVLKNWIVQDDPQTDTTVASQQFYEYPSNVQPPIESATVTLGGIAYPLQTVEAQSTWDFINQLTFSGTVFPQFIFPRRNDYGIWPIPGSSGDTITFLARLADRDMTIDDFTTGTVTVTNGDATITHSATGFTAAMVGRWFGTDDDGFWYRIASFTDTSNMELERTFTGTTAAGASFTIGESPEIPAELHELLPHKAAGKYLAGVQNELVRSQRHINYYWTGDLDENGRTLKDKRAGLLGAMNRYAGRDTSRVVENPSIIHSIGRHEAWVTTLS